MARDAQSKTREARGWRPGRGGTSADRPIPAPLFVLLSSFQSPEPRADPWGGDRTRSTRPPAAEQAEPGHVSRWPRSGFARQLFPNLADP
ncbi:unnamed protein product [Rangifer tarandus platyrhynchus]|uniref:Uncharacterized protein n=1 Tax=Rangifer tarandus platyrhynchus TaxID=3082113 RepID=A0AC59Z2U3_RANTA